VRAEDPEEIAIDDAVVDGHQWRLVGALYLPLVALSLLAIASPRLGPTCLWLACVLPAIVAVCYAVPSWRGWFKARQRGSLTVTKEALCLGGVPLLPRAGIARGVVEERGSGKGRLVLTMGRTLTSADLRSGRLGNVVIDLQSIEEARALSRALGTDVLSEVATVAVQPSLGRLVFLPSLVGLIALASMLEGVIARGIHGEVVATYLVTVLCLALGAIASLARLRVGTDGIEQTWLWRRRFVPYGDVREVLVENKQVIVVLGDGHRLSWRLESGERADWVESRLRQAFEAYRSSAKADAGGWLVRGDRTTEEWARALRAVGSGTAVTYRTAPPSRGELLRVAVDPAAATEVRVAAAVALGAPTDDDERARLRVAADVTALPKLRVVLLRASDAGADEDSLDELEPASAGTRPAEGMSHRAR